MGPAHGDPKAISPFALPGVKAYTVDIPGFDPEEHLLGYLGMSPK